MTDLKKKIEAEIEKLEDEGIELFFRVSSKDDNMQGNSVELSDITREQAAETFDVDLEDLDETLEEKYLYYDDKKSGVYWEGICVTSDIEAMADYYRNQQGGAIGPPQVFEGLYLYILSGNFLTWTEVGDGEVIDNVKIIKRYHSSVLREWFEY